MVFDSKESRSMLRSLALVACAVCTSALRIAVTGATGYLGSHVVQTALHRNHSVTAIVRDARRARGALLRDARIVEVPDLAVDGAVREHVADADVVIHTASIFQMCDDMEEELVVPNIALAEQLVRACAAAGARLVLTSSMAAVRGTRQPLAGSATTYTAADWNTISRRDGPGFEPYQYSKMESERRAWELARELSDESMLVSLCPPMLLGPPLDAASNAYSCELMRGWLDGTRPVRSLLMADVRDVALAHVRAAEEKSAGGRRLIVSSETRISAAEMASAITAAAAELGHTLDSLCVDDAETGGLIATGEREVESEEILAAALSVRCRPDAESLAEMASFLLCAARQPA